MLALTFRTELLGARKAFEAIGSENNSRCEEVIVGTKLVQYVFCIAHVNCLNSYPAVGNQGVRFELKKK